ncbi:hydroxycinnamoyltransferase 1-like [Cryptomeria japonica]|uniref:hydroxycinnamoyltransferase 1-like n=1 Tax=Cryptomeria japonica TaxID=3369 RepID=UPI0027DA5CFE|nr:hydroxycinnamoyltransferase 1-like [Cryptomeria japonica]
MDVTITNSVLVRPARDTSSEEIWLSNADLILTKCYACTTYIYRSIEEPDIFTDSNIEDLGDFSSVSKLSSLAITVDCTQSITSLPLLLYQVTKFRCGGVAIGVAINHIIADGMSSLHFVNTWCDLAHGLDVMVHPYLDRTLLQARNRPETFFPHLDCAYLFQHSLKRFRLTKEQLNCLKEKARENSSKEAFTTFIALSAHIWKCACISGNLLKQQETKLYIPINGRERVHPVLPCGYFANFGQGKPLFMGVQKNAPEGYCFIKPNSEDDGSLIIEMTLRSDRMDRFRKLLYQF